jgi:beta-glucuronidase
MIFVFGTSILLAQESKLITNISARSTTSLDGDWKTIVDPFDTGYYDYRREPTDSGFAQYNAYTDFSTLPKVFHYHFRILN